jgi:hypothetical protein
MLKRFPSLLNFASALRPLRLSDLALNVISNFMNVLHQLNAKDAKESQS